MNHLDYHTLEMFVLGSATVRAERQSISGHLSACEDCRRIAGEIAQFYAEVERHASAERHELLAPGAVTSTFGPTYCAGLRDSVMYWTGDAWRRPIATIHGREGKVRLP